MGRNKKGSVRRSAGDGSVYTETRNGKQVIVAAHTHECWIDGQIIKKRIKKRGFKTEKAAREWLAKTNKELEEFEKQKSLPTDPDAVTSENLTTKELWSQYVNSHAFMDLAKQTQKQYKIYYNKAVKLYDLKWNTISLQTFQKVVDYPGNTYDIRKKMRTVLSAMGTFAMRQGWARDNLVRKCVLPKEIVKDKQPYKPEEIEILWKFYNGTTKRIVEHHRNGKYYSDEDLRTACAAVLIMVHTGMRPVELLSVKPENINLDDREILHAGAKTTFGKERVIFFTTHIKELIKTYLLNGNKFLEMKRATFDDRIKALCPCLGIDKHLPSCCRTSTATLLASLGVDPEELRRILGHTDISMTRKHYDKSNNDRAKAALDLIDDALYVSANEKIKLYEDKIKELERKIEEERKKLEIE